MGVRGSSRFGILLGLALTLASCGIFVSFDGYDPGSGTYGLRGSVDGLEGQAKVTIMVGARALEAGNGPFAFPPVLPDHQPYLVTAQVPGFICTVENDNGRVKSAVVTNVLVHCRSTDASVTALSLDGAELTPPFDPGRHEYVATAEVALFEPTPTARVTATTRTPSARLVIGGRAAKSGVSEAFDLLVDQQRDIGISAISAAGNVTTSYAVDVSAHPRIDYLKPSPTDPELPHFGTSVALSGDTLVVGAPGESSAAGAAYVFTRLGRTWSQQAYLKASNTRATALFGTSVALSGDTLIVGAPDESSRATGVNGDESDVSVPDAGAVYVFTRSGTTWSQQAYVKASNTDSSIHGYFGESVALSGGTLVVGAPGEPSNATGVNKDQSDVSVPDAGAVYVFTRSGTTWSQQAYVKASNTRANARFGASLALSADTLVVGSPYESSSAKGINGNQSDTSSGYGAAYVFTRSGTTWSQQAYVKASNTSVDASFGISLALSADTLVVGSSGESSRATGINGDQSDTSAPGAGAAYVFVRNGTAWSQQAYVKASNPSGPSAFGEAVALVGDTLMVGASGEQSGATGINGSQTDTATVHAGAAYVFIRSGNVWSQKWYVKATNTRSEQFFGGSLAGSNDTLVVGARGESSRATGVNGDQTDTSAPGAGAAYVY